MAYVLGAANEVLADPLRPADVVGSWAGLRPLLAAGGAARTADLSRRHRVEASPGGVVTVTGGKLTTYRRMAADAVDEVVRLLGRGDRRSPTRTLALRGGRGGPPAGASVHLAGRYGSEAGRVAALAAQDPDLARPLVEGLPYLRAEAVYAARHEMAATLDDVLSRRTRALILARDASAAAAPAAARLLARELGWPAGRAEAEAAAYAAACGRERAAAGLGTIPAGS
ncbi:MAG: glycerol-3-phosphate dehydrogenase C-terminal domain-containing protein [Acidimicrobiia bacterium]